MWAFPNAHNLGFPIMVEYVIKVRICEGKVSLDFSGQAVDAITWAGDNTQKGGATMIIWGEELGAQKLDSDGVHFLEFSEGLCSH